MIHIGKFLLVISDIRKKPRWEVRLLCFWEEIFMPIFPNDYNYD